MHHLLDLGKIGEGLFRCADVGIADDFGERHAGPVEVDVAVEIAVGEAVVDGLAGVLLEMQPGDADALRAAVEGHVEPAVLGQGLVVLRDLVTLGQVGVEVVLARET